MTTVKVGPDLIDVVTLACRANKPVMLVGGTGIGKSESLEQAANAMGIEYIVLDLSIMEAPDLAGLPTVENGRMRYAPPAFLPQDGEGLLVFEEINRAPRYTQAPCYQLLTTRKLNDYSFPSGWRLAAAINPDGEDGYDVDALDKALLARFMMLQVEPDVKAWIQWAAQSGVHQKVIDYIQATPKIFTQDRSNPCAWKYVSDVLHAWEQGGTVTRLILRAAIAGFVGDDLAKAFLKTYTGPANVPSIPAILEAYRKLANIVRAKKEQGDQPFFHELSHELLLFLQDPSNEAKLQSTKRGVANLRLLLADMPPDISQKVVRAYRWLAPGEVKA